MDQTTDVERLFSWLKTQDLRYREFAAQREIADAVGSWPALHKAATASGHAADIAAPAGDAAAKERIAREQMPLPPAAAEAVRAGPPPVAAPAGGRLLSALGRRMQGLRPRTAAATATEPTAAGEPGNPGRAMPKPPPSRRMAVSAENTAAVSEAMDPAARERARDAAERLRDRLDAAMAVNPRPAAPHVTPSSRAAYDDRRVAVPRDGGAMPNRRANLFSGSYRDREESEYDAPPAGEIPRRGSSLQAVFSRLSASHNRPLRDPRARARGMPARGVPFGRQR